MNAVTLTKRLFAGVVFLSASAWASPAHAQIGVGTWVRQDIQGLGMTMTVEVCCKGGRRFTYHIAIQGQPEIVMTVDSPMDGTDVPALVGGKPSGQTIAIRRVDDRHYSGVMRNSGQPVATSNGTLSADGRTLTVETTTVAATGGPAPPRVIETWVLK